MDRIDWNAEPDLEQLRKLHSLLTLNPLDAITGLEHLAERGSAASMLYLANFYMEGPRSPHSDENKARVWYEKASLRGLPEASYMLGRLQYKSGEYGEAFAAFSKGHEGNYPPATYRLAKMFQKGEGIHKDEILCRTLLEEASKTGHVFAKRDLAGLLLTGRFGLLAFVKGAFILASLWSDVFLLLARSVKTRASLDERVLA